MLVKRLLYFIILLSFLALISPDRSEAANLSVAVVIGFNVGPYLESRDAFIERLNPKQAETFFLNHSSPKEIQWKIQRKSFSVVYAIGESALVFAINYLPDSNIVFSSVINPSRYLKTAHNKNIRGLSSMVPGFLFLKVVEKLSLEPSFNTLNIQTIITPESEKDFFPVGRDEKDKYHVFLISDSKDALKNLLIPGNNQRNLILTAPVSATLSDFFVLNAITLSAERKIIYPGHFKKMTQLGCLFSLAANPKKEGIKAADLFLNGDQGVQYYDALGQVDITFNNNTAKAFGILIPVTLLKEATAVY